MNASGQKLPQFAINQMLEVTPKKNAMMHAKPHSMLNVTSRMTGALDAPQALILAAGSLLTTARSNKEKDSANHKLFKDSTE